MDELTAQLTRAIDTAPSADIPRGLFRGAGAEQVARVVDGFCRHRLGAAVSGCPSAVCADGAAISLTLEDGRRIFVKVHNPTAPLASLTATSSVQAVLATRGFPCPAVVHPPVELPVGRMTIDAFVADGERGDPHDPAIRAVMASTLAELIDRAEPLRDTPGLPSPWLPPDTLWPPHHVLDASNRASEAEWIDRIARPAKEVVHEHAKYPAVLAHNDWTDQHFRYRGNAVSVIYDWDSLRIIDELWLVGGAAVSFARGAARGTVTPEEAAAFVEEYQRARGVRFGLEELRCLSAFATYTMAHIARIEHLLGLSEYPDSFRYMLRAHPTVGYLAL